MRETEKEFRARLTYLLVVHGGCRDVSMSRGLTLTSSDGGSASSLVMLRFKDRSGLEQSTTFDWPPARGAVDRIMSQVVGWEVYVHGMAVHAVPAVPNVGHWECTTPGGIWSKCTYQPCKHDGKDPEGREKRARRYVGADGAVYPGTTIRTGEYVASCEKCGTFNDRLVGLAGTRPEPWKHGLCSKCVDAERSQAERPAPVVTLPLDQAQATLQDYLAFLRDRCHALEQALVAERAAVVDLKEKLADLRLRAMANSEVAGVMVPGRELREPYVPPIDDVDLLPDA